MGSYLLLGFGLIVLLIILFLSRNTRSFTGLRHKLKVALFWNMTTRIFLEAYLCLSINSLFMVVYYLEWNSFESVYQSIIACGTLALVVIAPAYWTMFLRFNLHKFRKPSFKERFGSMIENLNFKEKSCSNYIATFCYRRLMQSLLIVAFTSRYTIQIQVMTAGSLMFIICAGMSNVHKDKYNKRLTIFNEVSLIVHCYLYFLFSEFLPDPVVRYSVGFALITNTAFNFSVNVFLMLFLSARDTRLTIKRWRHKRTWDRFNKKLAKIKMAEEAFKKIQAEQAMILRKFELEQEEKRLANEKR